MGERANAYRLGIDIGGTFTDIVLLDHAGTLHSKKILSTPADYSIAIEEGVSQLLRETGVRPTEIVELVHGTTVATNTIIERRGAAVALVTTQGFRDVLELGRFRSPRLYDLTFRKPEPLVERRFCFAVPERIDAQGRVLAALDERALRDVAQRIAAAGIEAVALCFVNSFVNPANELAAVDILRDALPGVSVSASVQLVPQIGEYERTSTTVVNAYVRPVVARYVESLTRRLERLGITAPLLIMQSSGGVLPGPVAATKPIFIIESGPAAGALGAQRLGHHLDLGDLIVFDMGGTTAKASIVRGGRLALAPETEVGGGASLGARMIKGAGYVVQVPTIDIAEVGAGGGSIAEVDVAGGLHVGPRSAGAEPGPVCYGRGGQSPTVTDANLLLGYLNPTALVGGGLKLAYGDAQRAIEATAARLGLSPTDTAYGIHLIANANMMRALKAVTTEGGHDPSRFTLMAIGGNGGVHAAHLAESLKVRRILVPPVAGLFSALGMLFADVEHQLITAFYRRLDAVSAADVDEAIRPLLAQAIGLLEAGGYTEAGQRDLGVYVDLKYVGQTAPLTPRVPGLPITDAMLAALGKEYGDRHRQAYGYRSDAEPLQCVSLKVIGRGRVAAPRVPDRVAHARSASATPGVRRAYFGPELGWLDARVLSREMLSADPLEGPAIVEEYDATTVVRPRWSVHIDAWNDMILQYAASE